MALWCWEWRASTYELQCRAPPSRRPLVPASLPPLVSSSTPSAENGITNPPPPPRLPEPCPASHHSLSHSHIFTRSQSHIRGAHTLTQSSNPSHHPPSTAAHPTEVCTLIAPPTTPNPTSHNDQPFSNPTPTPFLLFAPALVPLHAHHQQPISPSHFESDTANPRMD